MAIQDDIDHYFDRAQWLKANPGKTIGDYVRAKYPRHRPDKGAV
jgi:phage terminase large subunit-like protein